MLSFDEDGLDETAPYGPQHSTPVKNKFGNSNSSLPSHPKGKLTVSQGKSSERKELRDSFTSPSNPNECSMCKSAGLSSRRQCAHMAQHFIPEDGVDISQIPPSEGGHAQHKSLPANQCDECYCVLQNSEASLSKSRSQAFSNSSNHGEHVEGNIKCSSCAVTTTKGDPQCESQYTPQPQYKCRHPSSSYHQSRTSTPSRRSDTCCPRNHGLYHRTSDASLSALTSDCCSPKQTKSSAYNMHSLDRNVVSIRPGCQSSSSICRPGCTGQKFRSHSLPRTGYSGINLCNHSTELDMPTLSIADITKTSAIFLDKDIISKQREEIQLLMEELAGRDQELNDLVTSHQKQVRVWEADRDKLDSLQDRLTKYEEELSNKEQQLRETLEEMGRVQEQKELDLTELGRTQADMVKLAERISENSSYIHEIEIQNKSLGASVKQLLADKKHLEDRERELIVQIDAKNAESINEQAAMKKMAEKIESLESQVEIIEEECQRKVQENEAWRAKFFMEKDEAEKLAANCDSKDLTMAKMTQQLQESLQQAVALQKALFTSCEREKCKEEVLHSLRKQHKRTMLELSNIRELYDLRNRDLTTHRPSVKDSAVMYDKSARSSLSGRDDFLDKASIIKETRAASRKRRETQGDKEGGNSISNELSESHTDAQFDGDEQLNTCHSHLTNVMVSPKSELQECNTGPKPLHSSNGGSSHAPDRFHPKTSISVKSGNAVSYSRTRERPLKFADPRLNHSGADPAQLHSEPQPQPHSSCSFARCQGQALNQPVSQPHQHLSHPQDVPDLQQQTGSDLSNYSTASAASVNNHHASDCRNVSHSKLTDRQEKLQVTKSRPPELIHNPPARKIQSIELTADPKMEKSESDRKSWQKEHHHHTQYKVEESSAGKSYSPRRGLSKMERRYMDQREGSSPGKRNVAQTKVASPSRSLSRGRNGEDHPEHYEVEMRNNPGYADRTTGDCNSETIQASQQKQNVQGEMQKNSSGNHQVINAKESLGSLISKHADSSASPVQHLVNKLTSKDVETPISYERARKKFKPKGKGSRWQAEEFPQVDDGGETLERKTVVIRQDSYVINEQVEQAAQVKSCMDETWSSRNKLARHCRKEERQMDFSPDNSSHRGQRLDKTDSVVKEETRKVEQNHGRSTPGLCPSASDVSNFPFDDELTPADSDGMCRELKRDLKKMRSEQSPGAKVSYRKCSAVKNDNGNKRAPASSDDKDKTPQASVCNGHVEPIPQRESKNSCSTREPRAPRSNVIQSEGESRKNSSFHSERSPDWDKGRGDVSHNKRLASHKEHDKSPGDKAGKSYQSEKHSHSKKKKRCPPASLDDDFSKTKQVSGTSSRHSRHAPSENLTGEYEDDDVCERSQAKFHQREKDELNSKSLEMDDLPSGRHRYQGETHLEFDSKTEDRALQPQHKAFDEHPCISPRPHEASTRYALTDTAIGSDKVSHYYSHGQYGSPDLSREACYTSRHLHSVGLGLDTSMSRSAGLGLSPTRSMGASYTKSDVTSRHIPSSGLSTQCPSGSGMASTSTTYSSRRFLPSGVGTYLSSRLNSWYRGSGSMSYALNNNNENGSYRCSPDCKDDGYDDCDYTDGSRSSDVRCFDDRHLNTNNNKDCEFADLRLAGNETHENSNNDKEKDSSNNNNNINPVNINDISLEEIMCANGSYVSPEICPVFGVCEKATYSPDKEHSCSDVDVSVRIHQNPKPAADSPEIQCMVPPLNPNTEAVASKPFTTRGQPSLYRQLAQIHFSEKTRRYEWVVVPSHFAEVEQKAESAHGSNCEHAPELPTYMFMTNKQTSELEPVQIPNREKLDSRSSDDSCFNSVSLSSLDTGISHKNEANSRTGITTTATHSDSGLCSLSSYEGIHACSYSRQKSRDSLHPFPAHNHGVSPCDPTTEDVRSSQPAHGNSPEGMAHVLKPQCHSSASNLNNNSIDVSMGSVAMSKTCTASTSSCTVAYNIRTVTTVTSICHSNSIISTSPSATMVDSFMGVSAVQQKTPQPDWLNHRDDGLVDNQTYAKHSHLPKHSSSLDEVVRKLDFDDTTLDASTVGTLDTLEVIVHNLGHLGKKVESDSTKIDSGGINTHSPQRRRSLEELSVKEEECFSIVKAAGSSRLSSEIVSSKREDTQGETPENKDGKENRHSFWNRADLCSTSFQGNCKDDCDTADSCGQPSLSEYFQDISSLSVEPDSAMSHKVGEIPGYKYVTASTKHAEKPQCINGLEKELQHTEAEVKTKATDRCGHQISCVFNPHTMRYVSLLKLDNGIYKEVLCHGDSDTVSGKRFAEGKLSNSDSAQYKHPDSGIEDDTGCKSQYKGSSRSQGVWIYRDSVEEVAEHFDDKLSSFLEEKDLVDTTQKILQGSPPPMSPASKLQHLLLESQHLIWALERSSAVPEALRSGLTHF